MLLHPFSIDIDIILAVDHLACDHGPAFAAVIPFTSGGYPVVHHTVALFIEVIPLPIDHRPYGVGIAAVGIAPPPAGFRLPEPGPRRIHGGISMGGAGRLAADPGRLLVRYCPLI